MEFKKFIFDDGKMLVEVTNDQIVIGHNSPLFDDYEEEEITNILLDNEYLSIEFMFNSINQIILYNNKEFKDYNDVEVLLGEFIYQIEDDCELEEITNKEAFRSAFNLIEALSSGRKINSKYGVYLS